MAYERDDEYRGGISGVKEGALALRHTDISTGEENELPTHLQRPGELAIVLRDETFLRASKKRVTVKQDKILRAATKPTEEADIKPTGEVYVSHVFVRRRLNDAFGPGGWALRPLSNETFDPVSKVMYCKYALMAGGAVLAVATGSTKYQPTNDRMDYADAAEAVKSNALTRCSKDLGICSECWDRRWCEHWREKFAVHVWTMQTRRRDNQTKEFVEAAWRRIDSAPLVGECAVFSNSPNRDKVSLPVADNYQQAQAAYRSKQAPPSTPQPNRPEPTRQPAPPQAQSPQPASKPQQPPQSGTIAPGKVDSKLAPYILKSCLIKGNGPNKTKLYEIITHSGRAYYTFSSTIYNRCQHAFAAREAVELITNPKQWSGKDMIEEVIPYREA